MPPIVGALEGRRHRNERPISPEYNGAPYAPLEYFPSRVLLCLPTSIVIREDELLLLVKSVELASPVVMEESRNVDSAKYLSLLAVLTKGNRRTLRISTVTCFPASV